MKKTCIVVLCFLLLVSFMAGASGEVREETARLQLHLMRYGYYSKKIDGDFGNGTRQAVIDFQSANGLEATGEVDEPTTDLLYNGSPVSALPDFVLRDGITWNMKADEVDAVMASEGISAHEDVETSFMTTIGYKKVPVSDYKVSMYGWMLGEFGLQGIIYVTIPNSYLKGSELIPDYENLRGLLETKYGDPDGEWSEWTDEDSLDSILYSEEDGAWMGKYTRICRWTIDGGMLELCLDSQMEEYGLARKPTVWIAYYSDFLTNVIEMLDNTEDEQVYTALLSSTGFEVVEPNMNGL